MPKCGITPAEGRTGNTTPHTKPRPTAVAWAQKLNSYQEHEPDRALLGTALDRSRRGSARRVNTPMSEGYPRRLRVSTRLVFNNPRIILPDHTSKPKDGVARRLLDRLNAARAEHRTTCAGSTKKAVKMPRARRICPKPGCPQPATKRYCTEHEREYERARGNSTQRGYDSKHQTLRKQWRERIDRGGINCASCGLPIHPQAPFDLGHTDDRTAYKGAEHAHCNRSDGGRRGRANQR